MQALNKNEKRLAKYLEQSKKLYWNEYLKRFEGTKPIEMWPTMYDTLRITPEEVECEIKLIGTLSSKFSLKKFDKIPKIVGGFKKKVTKEEIDKLDYLNPSFLGLGRLYRKNVIDIMQRICPYDFEPVPVTLISQNKLVEPFEIKDFYAINVLKCIKAVDEEKSIVEWSQSGMAHIRKLRYKENPWQDGCIPISGPNSPNNASQYPQHQLDKPCMLAIDALSGAIIWHPTLAKQMPVSPMLWFITDVEQKG